MKNREIEVFLLKIIKNKYEDFFCMPSTDKKYNYDVNKLPRVTTKVISDEVIEEYDDFEHGTTKARYIQYDIHRKTIRFIFVLNKEYTEEEVNNIKAIFNHKIGMDWMLDRADKDLVIEELTSTIDISENNAANYLERYSFDMIVRTTEKNIAEIEYVNEVQFRVEEVGGKRWL